MRNKTYRTLLIFCTLIWTALVLYGSLAPGDDLPPAGWLAWIPHLDKVVHFIFYAGETTLLLLLFEPRGWRKLWVILPVIATSGLVEYLQGRFFERSNDPWDFLANTLGACFALWLAPFLKRKILDRIFTSAKKGKMNKEKV